MFDAVVHKTALLAWIVASCLIHSLLSHKVVKIAIGQTAYLPCTVDIAGKIDVEWIDPEQTLLTLNDEVQTQDRRISIQHPYIKEWILVISNVRADDAGTYTCHIGPISEISYTVELIVTIPPEITRTSGEGKYLLSSTVTLTCAAKGTPEPKITWHRLDEHHRLVELTSEGGTYVIESIDWTTAGRYECHANNDVLPSAVDSLMVHVLFAPVVKVPYHEVFQEQGKWTQLSCLVSANPKPDVYWKRNGHRIKDSASRILSEKFGYFEVMLQHSVERLSDSDFGIYECHAENTYGKDEGLISLAGTQTKKAVLISTPRDAVAASGEDVLLNCSVFNLPKGDHLVWWFRSLTNETRKLFVLPSVNKNSQKNTELTSRGLESTKHDIVGQYNLLIRQANFSDRGVYICEITGHENHSANLDVIAKNDPSAFCEKNKNEPFDLTTTLIILAIVVFLLLIVAIVVIVLVSRLLVRRSRNEPVQLNSKFRKIDL